MTDQVCILVADDEPNVVVTMQAILEMEGYRVRPALNAREVRAAMAAERLDVALLDLRLDDADGIELLEELKGRQPQCEAIMLTGYASLESAVRAIRHGAYDYLVKPCDLDELKLTIAHAVERGAMARSLRERLTELEAANATIRSLADELQGRVDRATADLSLKVEELSEAKRRLEREQRQREEFISMIAHELGQPLTNISGYAQLLGRPRLSAEVHDRARRVIVGETQRLTRLVRDLTDVARLSSGRFRISLKPADLAEIVRGQVELARSGAQRHTIELDVPSDEVPVLCDQDRIAQVLSNLLSNATKYTPGGAVRVALCLQPNRALVSVADEGPGIPPDRLEAIFDAHVRLPGDGADEQEKGAGLGLFITRGIVEAHGGRIWAESAPGAGTTFTLWLPRAQT